MVRKVKVLLLSFILTSISSVLLSLSMPRAGLNLSALEWIALVPWFFAIRGKRPLYAFLISLWTGILFWGITIFWLRLVTGLGFFLLLPYLGLYFAMFGMVMNYIHAIMPLRAAQYLLCPLLWILLERLRGSLFGGFPWLNLSYGQYLNIPLLQWASLGGEGIISGVIILVNLFIMTIFLPGKRKKFISAVALFLVIGLIYSGGKILSEREIDKEEKLKVAVIQPNIIEKWDRGFLEENFDVLMGLSYESLKEKPRLIIWPESAFGFELEKDRLYLEKLKRFTAEFKSYLLVGTVKELTGGKFYNRAVLISPEGKISSYDKVRLVPFGEYVPLGNRYPWWKKWVENIAGYRFSFIAGKEQRTLCMDTAPFGVLICFEDIFPAFSRKFKQKKAKFLVNITDDRWFGKSNASYQHLAASVLRAVENRLPLVRSANTGISAFVDSSGRITNMLEKEGRAIFVRGFSVKEISF
jgi:apolipoprotein N-acyltransferase